MCASIGLDFAARRKLQGKCRTLGQLGYAKCPNVSLNSSRHTGIEEQEDAPWSQLNSIKLP